MSERRILVTGAAGCVGRALCRTLVERGYSVRAVIRSRESASRLTDDVEIGWSGEISSKTNWPRELFAGIESVVHLAAKVHCRRGGDAAEFMEANACATETLIGAAAAAGVRRFVYCSSVHAVASFSEQPLDETSPCLPQTPYGASKLAGEQGVRRISRESKIEAVIVRPVPIYGPDLPGNLMQILRLLSRGWPLPIGAIHSRRSLVYVDNVVDALILASQHPSAAGETFFVSDGGDVSLSELATLYSQASDRRTHTIAIPAGALRCLSRAVGMRNAGERLLGSLRVDSSKISRVLGWKQLRSLPDALSVTADSLRRAA